MSNFSARENENPEIQFNDPLLAFSNSPPPPPFLSCSWKNETNFVPASDRRSNTLSLSPGRTDGEWGGLDRARFSCPKLPILGAMMRSLSGGRRMLLTTTAYFTSDKVLGPGHLALDTFSPGLEISQGSGQGVHLLTVAFGSEQGGRVSDDDDDDEDGGEERRNILLRPETDRRKNSNV